VNKVHGRTLGEKEACAAHRVGIHEARKKKFSTSKDDEGYICRSVLSEDAQKSRLVDVFYDPVNIAGWADGEQTPRQSLERGMRYWTDDGTVEDGPRTRK
jgi:hypothetical protein